MNTIETELREDDWVAANATVESAVYTLAMQLHQESKDSQADRLLASWARLKRG